MRYFSYCPENGFEEHDTEDEAKAEAQERIDIAMGDGPIPEWIDQIRWGLIRGSARVINERKPDPESHTESQYDFIADVELIEDSQ